MCMSCQLQQPLQTSNRFIHKTMSIGIGDNFNYQGSKFNMDRDSFQTKEAMKSYPETSLPPKGFRAYCAEDDEYYEFNAENSVDPETGKWRMVDNPTAKKTVEDAKTNGDYAKEQGDAAKEAARKVTNDVLFKVFQSLTEEEQTQVKQNIGIGVEQKFQGQFESYSELEGVSSPAVGDYAYVGNPRNLYAYKSSGWANLGAFNYNIDQELDADSERGIANGVVTEELYQKNNSTYIFKEGNGTGKNANILNTVIKKVYIDTSELPEDISDDKKLWCIQLCINYTHTNDDGNSYLGTRVWLAYKDKTGVAKRWKIFTITGDAYVGVAKTDEIAIKNSYFILDATSFIGGEYDNAQVIFTGEQDLCYALSNIVYVRIEIQDNSVTSAKIQDNSVTSAKIQDNAVTSRELDIKPLIYIDEYINDGVDKNVILINDLIKRLYISPDDIPSDCKYDDYGYPIIAFRQILYKYNLSGIYLTNRIMLNYMTTDDEWKIGGFLIMEQSDNPSALQPLGSKIVYSSSRKSMAEVDFDLCLKYGYEMGSQPAFDESDRYKINFGKLERFPFLTGDEEIISSLKSNLTVWTKTVATLWPYIAYNLGNGEIVPRTQGGLDTTRYCGIFRAFGLQKYKLEGYVSHSRYNSGIVCYSDFPTDKNWKDVFLSSVYPSEEFYSLPKGTNWIVYVTNEENRYTEVTLVNEKDIPEPIPEPEVPELKTTKPLSKYTLYTIGDSLSAGGQWQSRVVERTGIQFDQNKNAKPGASLSVGGTGTGGGGLTMGYMRTRLLIEQGYIEGDGENTVILLENVNDGAFTFSSDAKTFNITKILDGPNQDSFNAEYLSGIPVEDKNLNTAIKVSITSSGKVLTIDTLPTKEGDITIRTGWAGPTVKSYNIHVVPQDTDEETRQYVIEKILEYDYTGVTDIAGENGNSVIFCGNGGSSYETTLEFTDTGDTGMTCSITSTDSASYEQLKFFLSNDVSADWTNPSRWGTITTGSAWKSSIELLQRTYPKAIIMVTNFPSISRTQSEYLQDDGTYNSNSFRDYQTNTQKQPQRTETLRSIAEYYDLPFVDVWSRVGIGINNLTTFYPETANVHPKTEGYQRFGDVVSSILMQILNSEVETSYNNDL